MTTPAKRKKIIAAIKKAGFDYALCNWTPEGIHITSEVFSEVKGYAMDYYYEYHQDGIHPELEVIAKKFGGYFEFENAGVATFCEI